MYITYGVYVWKWHQKEKGEWTELKNETPAAETKKKASSIIIGALGDGAFRVCSSVAREPLKMLEKLDTSNASTRTVKRVPVQTTVLSSRFSSGDVLPKHIAEFEYLFLQLEIMGKSHAMKETYKAPLLLSSSSRHSPLQSTVTSLG